jgi:hypothetical protein
MAAATESSPCIAGVLRSRLKGSTEFLRSRLNELLVLRMLDHKRQLKGNDPRLEDLGWVGDNLPLNAILDIS